MRYVSDDRALRVEEIATELPGEMPWRIWVRAFVAFWPTSAVICSGLWAVGTALGAGPWWLIVALLCGVTAAATTVLAVLGWISRYETPDASAVPVAHGHRGSIRATPHRHDRGRRTADPRRDRPHPLREPGRCPNQFQETL